MTRILLAVFILVVALPARAQLIGTDTAPGSSCAGFPDGATRMTADADLDGDEVTLVCDGTNWNAVGGGGGGGSLPSCTQGAAVVRGASAWECECLPWTETAAADSWGILAISADASVIVQGINDGIATSTDKGQTWTSWTTGDLQPQGAAISADGTKLAVASHEAYIYTSTNGGTSWTQRGAYGDWVDVASSSDGTKLVAAREGGLLATSTNSGVNWTSRSVARQWRAVASSSDGVTLYAAAGDPGYIYRSTDSGVTWTQTGSASREWTDIASSADGSTLAAVEQSSKWLYTSSNSGANWTQRVQASGGGSWWDAVAVSADGTKMVASEQGTPPATYYSDDSGVTWRKVGPIGSSLTGAKITADGSQVVIVNGDPQMLLFSRPCSLE